MPNDETSAFSRRNALVLALGGLATVGLAGCTPPSRRVAARPSPSASSPPPPPEPVAVTPTATPSPSPMVTLLPTPPAAAGPIFDAARHGVVGNGLVDDAPALQALLLVAAAAGGSVSLARDSRSVVKTPLLLPSATDLRGNGATLINSSPGGGGRTLTIKNVVNIRVSDVSLDGNRQRVGAVSEQRHNIFISGSKNVLVERVRSFEAKGDGIYIGDPSNGTNTNVTLRDSAFENNHRQGLSITTVSGLLVDNCQFNLTRGTPPACGVDIEPGTRDNIVENITFVNCSMRYNHGGGLQILTHDSGKNRQQSGTYIDCTFSDNPGSPGVLVRSATNLRIVGGEISRNGATGVMILPTRHLAPTDAIVNTTLQGLSIVGNSGPGVQAITSFAGLTVSSVFFQDNGNGTGNAGGATPTPSTGGFGISLIPASGHTGKSIKVTDSTFATMTGGVEANAACTDVSLANNRYSAIKTNTSIAN